MKKYQKARDKWYRAEDDRRAAEGEIQEAQKNLTGALNEVSRLTELIKNAKGKHSDLEADAERLFKEFQHSMEVD